MYDQNNLVLMANKKSKGNSRCAICMANKSFSDKNKHNKQLENTAFQFVIVESYKTDNDNILYKCRKKIKNLNSKTFKTKNNRSIIQSKFAAFGIKKSKFVKEKESKRFTELFRNLNTIE